MEIKITILKHGPEDIPKYATQGSAGMDIQAAIDKPIIVKPGKRILIPTGFKVEIPENFEIQVRPRSGLAIKHGISVLNSPGTIDSDYRGEIGVILINHGDKDFKINPFDRIAQIVVTQIIKVNIIKNDDLSKTQRGSGGFGSTGENND
tara:strand:+ start:140 stop:586 length:447 start_codon:yes stop_codon:yes gene_type:complete